MDSTIYVLAAVTGTVFDVAVVVSGAGVDISDVRGSEWADIIAEANMIGRIR